MRPFKILLVDDDCDDVEWLLDAFSHKGETSVYCANSARQAFAYLTQIKNSEDLPRIIVTDLFLPAKNGIEMIIDLKKSPEYCNIPIIVFSDLRAELNGDTFQHLGVLAYINKPYTYNEYLTVAEYIKQLIAA